MVRASEKVRAKKIMPRACPSFQKAWLDRAELLKTPGSRAQIRAEPRLDPALKAYSNSGRRLIYYFTYKRISDYNVLSNKVQLHLCFKKNQSKREFYFSFKDFYTIDVEF